MKKTHVCINIHIQFKTFYLKRILKCGHKFNIISQTCKEPFTVRAVGTVVDIASASQTHQPQA